MAQLNPEGHPSALRLIIRGAAWSNCDPAVMRPHRASNTPVRDRNNLGFRTFLNTRESAHDWRNTPK